MTILPILSLIFVLTTMLFLFLWWLMRQGVVQHWPSNQDRLPDATETKQLTTGGGHSVQVFYRPQVHGRRSRPPQL